MRACLYKDRSLEQRNPRAATTPLQISTLVGTVNKLSFDTAERLKLEKQAKEQVSHACCVCLLAFA